MSIKKVKEYLSQFNKEDSVLEFTVSSATVELAAQALQVEGARIAKTLSFSDKEESQCVMVVTAGDARVDNKKFKAQFQMKAKMLNPETLFELTNYRVGGVSPFPLTSNCRLYLDISLKRFTTVFPACGSANSAIELTIDELYELSKAVGWVDVCSSWN